MLEGWKNDPENFQTADEQFDAYMRFYNACFEVSEGQRFHNTIPADTPSAPI